MVCHLFSFIILFIPIVIGINNTVPINETTGNSSAKVTPKTLITVNNSVTNFSIISEGGTIVAQKPITLKENDALLIDRPDPEALLENSSKSKGTVPRKGVHLEDAPEQGKHGNTSEVKSVPTPTALSSVAPKKQKTVLLDKLTKHTSLKPVTPSTIAQVPVHKPLVLPYDALKDIPESTSFSAKGPVGKQALNPGSHPGMVMPVVITILVVPMFAVLGYLALKRGQEAWKNRHYKRMDFLLDGMYND